MDPMADSTFETTRDRYNDLVERINEARAAYLESVEKIKWALRCLEIHRLHDADGVKRAERTRVQSALESAFSQWVEAERPKFEQANAELRELLKQEEHELILWADEELVDSFEHAPHISEDHEYDEAEKEVPQQDLFASGQQDVDFAQLAAVLPREIFSSWQNPFQRWAEDLKPLSRAIAQLSGNWDSSAAFQKLAKTAQLAAAGPLLQISESQKQAVAESMGKVLEAIQANFNLQFDYFTDLYKVRSLQINEARAAYYDRDSPTLADADYDRMYREVEEIEERYPQLRGADSPTMSVGGSVDSGFAEVRHLAQMMSLDDVFSLEELAGWETLMA